jgi:serine/threonine protein kinase
MCTGRPPFRADTPYGVLRRISESDSRPIRELVPETPDWLCEIVERLHAKNPPARFQSAGEVEELLGRWLFHLQQPATCPAPPRQLRTSSRRSRARTGVRWIAAAAVLAGICVVVFVAGQLQDIPAPSAPGGNGPAPTRPAVVAQQPAPNELSIDEKALVTDSQAVRSRTSVFQRAWNASPPAQDSLDREIDEVGRQIEELSKRIEQGAP